MLKEAIEMLMVRGAQQAQPIVPSDQAPMMAWQDGRLVEQDTPVRPLLAEVEALDDVVTLLVSLHDGVIDNEEERVHVFVGPNEVEAVFPYGVDARSHYGPHCVVMPLKATTAFTLLRRFNADGGGDLSQTGLVELLRVDMRDSLADRSDGAAEAFARMKGSVIAKWAAEQEHGRDAMGRDVVVQTTGPNDSPLPQSIYFQLAACRAMPDFEVGIEATISVIQKENGPPLFRLRPSPDDVENAMTASRKEIVRNLRARPEMEAVTVLIGERKR